MWGFCPKNTAMHWSLFAGFGPHIYWFPTSSCCFDQIIIINIIIINNKRIFGRINITSRLFLWENLNSLLNLSFTWRACGRIREVGL